MKLYTAKIGPNAKRARICAAEVGITLDSQVLDFQKGEHRAFEYLALNPTGKVPTLDDGGFVLWESCAILCYMAQSSGSALWPKAAREQADTLRWLFFVSCHIDPYYTTLVVERFVKGRQGEPADEAQTRAAEQWLARFVPVVDQQLAARDYLTGSFGLGDIALGCTLEISPLVSYDLAPYENVRAWLERLQGRASWRAADYWTIPGSEMVKHDLPDTQERALNQNCGT